MKVKSILIIIISLSLALCSLAQSEPCNFSGNLGEKPSLVFSSCDDPMGSGAGCAFYIQRLTLETSCDDPLKLILQIEYEGEEGVVLIQPLNIDKKPIKKYESSTFKLSPNNVSSYEIQLDTSIHKEFKSFYIQLTFAESKRRLNKLTPYHIYSLVKIWCNLPSCNIVSKNKQSPVVAAKTIPLSKAKEFNVDVLKRRCSQVNKKKVVEIYSKGPSSKRINLNTLVSSDLIDNVSSLFGVEYVFEDEETKSGYFYWYPESYTLKWTMEDGFSTKHIYSSQSEATENNIQFYAELITGIDDEKLKSVQSILSVYAKEKYGVEEAILLPLPIKENPRFINNWQAMFGVEPVAMLQGSDFNSRLKIQFSVNQNNLAKIGVSLLNELGLSGSLDFTPSNNTVPKINIPIEISLHPHKQYVLQPNEIKVGSRENRYWKNRACHPLNVQTINFLVLSHSSSCNPKFVVYSWRLTDKQGEVIRVPGKSNLYIKLDNELKALLKDHKNVFARWLDFEVLDKSDCNAEVVNQLISNSFDLKGSLAVEQIMLFQQIPNLQKITVKVRSSQLSYQADNKIMKEVSFAGDDEAEESIGPFLFTSNTRTPYYEYQILLTSKNGEKYSSTWIPEKGDSLTIGTSTIKKNVKGFKWD